MDPKLAFFFPITFILVVFFNRYFFGLLLFSFRSRERRGVAEFTSLPQVNVIIPMYNEGSSIFGTLESIAAQDYPRDRLRITVVDDCSTDDSLQWVEKAAKNSGQIHIMRNATNIGKRLGISRAVRESIAEIIVSIDSDVIVAPNAVRELIAGFTDPKIAAVGGRVYVGNCHQNWLTKMQAIKYFFGYQYLKNLENSFSSVMCLSGCLTAYRRSVLIDLDPIIRDRNLMGIPVKYGEDRFLTRQIVKAGYRTRLMNSALCYTKAPPTLGGYFAQQLRWRRSNLVDFLGGISHIWRLNVFVAMHYLALNCMLWVYPVFLWGLFLSGHFFESTLLHLGALGIYGLVYQIQALQIPERFRVSGIHILWMAVLMPVTYMVLTVVALFTLDSGSWETRSPAKTR